MGQGAKSMQTPGKKQKGSQDQQVSFLSRLKIGELVHAVPTFTFHVEAVLCAVQSAMTKRIQVEKIPLWARSCNMWRL